MNVVLGFFIPVEPESEKATERIECLVGQAYFVDPRVRLVRTGRGH